MQEYIFKDQIAIVTGAGQGIGHEIARQLALQGAAVLLNDMFLSSVAGNQAIATSSVYTMTKKGLEMLARSLVSEVSAHGITVNVVAPGATVTPRTVLTVPDYEPN